MSQSGGTNIRTLPGIVTDQPEIYESERTPSDGTDVSNLNLDEPTDDVIGLIEVPIRQAFSYFAERENEIAKFYVQRLGEYRISGSNSHEETDIEKYHRLVSEVNQLLNKFQADRSEDKTLSIGTDALTNNLEILARQLKALEFAAEDGSLTPTQAGFSKIKSKIDQLKERVGKDQDEDVSQLLESRMTTDETNKLIRMSALERRLSNLESSVGKDDDSLQNLFRVTGCDSLINAAERLGTWLSLSQPDNLHQTNKELDFMIQLMEKTKVRTLDETSKQMDDQSRDKLEQLYRLVCATDKQRAMVPTILHRLNAIEELQQKAAHVTTTVNHLEQVQSQIVENLQANKVELNSLTEMFTKNIELMKQFSQDIDMRIAAIREKNQ